MNCCNDCTPDIRPIKERQTVPTLTAVKAPVDVDVRLIARFLISTQVVAAYDVKAGNSLTAGSNAVVSCVVGGGAAYAFIHLT